MIDLGGRIPRGKKIEDPKGTGLVLLSEGTGMIEIKDMREMLLEKKKWDMILNGQKESIARKEKWWLENDPVTVTEKSLVIVTVSAKGVIEIVTGTDTGKIGTDMQIITGIETVNQSMRMSGKGDGRLGLTVNQDYHRMRNTILGQKMLIMGKGGG